MSLNYLISILDHLTKSSTEFVVNKIQSQFNDPSKTLMVWVGAQRQRTSNFRGEEWLWESSKDQVLGQLICFFPFLFRSVPLQFHSIERRLNRKGTGLEWEWNGMVMERELSGNGTGAKREWNGNGTKIQWSDNECSVHGAWTVI